MAKNIQFDPELVRLIKTIYGDAELNGRTLQLLHQTWKTNPDIIRKTALLKTRESYFDAQESPAAPSFLAPSFLAPKSLLTQEIASDDLRGVKDFNTAFRAARERGLKLFMWGNSVYTTDLEQPLNKPKAPIILLTPLLDYQVSIENPNLITSTKGTTFGRGLSTITGNSLTTNLLSRVTEQSLNLSLNKSLGNSVLATANRYTMQNTVQGGDFGINRSLRKVGRGFMNFLNWLNEGAANNLYNRNRQVNQHGYYQQGGTMNNQLEILKKAFINYLVQVTGARSELDLAKLSQDLIKQLYQLFSAGIQNGSIEVSQDGQVNVKGRKAALGAKLSYFNKLQGKCPEGEQLVTFKIGGRMCTACLKGNKVLLNTKSTKQQPTKKLDPEKTPVLPGGKYPSYWTADDRIKWERKYGLGDEGAAVAPPPVKKNKLGAALLLLLNKNR